MAYTFKGGVHIPEHKNTASKKIRVMPAPEMVTIPLSQHIGVQCVPCVKVGDIVDKGQTIGIVEKGLGCPVHASISGKIAAIEEKINTNGARVSHIVIENDGEDRMSSEIEPYNKTFEEMTFEAVVEVTRRAGISGMGGATFPTYAKIQSARGKVDRLIINCAECEPYITANHRLLLEDNEAVIGGVKILLKAFELGNAEIAIEDNKSDAIKIIENAVADTDLISVKVLKTKYPQGDERQIIYALTGREIPAGKLPADVGCVVFNAETCAAIYRAFAYGSPLISRIVTVAGDCVKDPCSVLAPIGTPYSALIDFCGGLKREPKTVISGGPMMGIAQWDINAPVTKGTSAILVFSQKAKPKQKRAPACIRCGRCVKVCQMNLLPSYLALFASEGKYDMCEKYDVMSCVECGGCSYICPGNVPITQLNRISKAKINEKRKKMKEAANNGK